MGPEAGLEGDVLPRMKRFFVAKKNTFFSPHIPNSFDKKEEHVTCHMPDPKSQYVYPFLGKVPKPRPQILVGRMVHNKYSSVLDMGRFYQKE